MQFHLFFSLTQRTGLHSYSSDIKDHKGGQGALWKICHFTANPRHTPVCGPKPSTPPLTEDQRPEDSSRICLVTNPTNRTILVSHISKLFLNSSQTNDGGNLGTQVLWEMIWVFICHHHGDLGCTVSSPMGKPKNSHLGSLWINRPQKTSTHIPSRKLLNTLRERIF